MPRLAFAIAALLSLAFIAAACGGGNDGNGPDGASGDIAPIPGNSELVVGPNRFALGLIDENNEPVLEAPGVGVHLRFLYNGELRSEQDAGFTWAIPDVNGFFVTDVDFDQAGEWTAEAVLTRDGEESTVSFTFQVTEEGSAPTVGEPVPASTNLTAADVPELRRISTDTDPNPAFYEMTVADALEAGQPFVVAFATPAFCQTRFCGPVLDNVKEVAPVFQDRVNFIHIEPFQLDEEGRLVPGDEGFDRVPADVVTEWGLQTEPWIFVVNGDGTVAARFEGAASTDELDSAIAAVAG